jgi:hypothetical protein
MWGVHTDPGQRLHGDCQGEAGQKVQLTLFTTTVHRVVDPNLDPQGSGTRHQP